MHVHDALAEYLIGGLGMCVLVLIYLAWPRR
jgi:hypothetical protein